MSAKAEQQGRKKANKKKYTRDYNKTLCGKGINRNYADGIPTDQCEKCQHPTNLANKNFGKLEVSA